MYKNKLFQSEFWTQVNLKIETGCEVYKIVFNLQYGKSLSIVRLSVVLKSNEILPKYGKTKLNSLLGTMMLRSFLINNLLTNLLIHWFTKFLG